MNTTCKKHLFRKIYNKNATWQDISRASHDNKNLKKKNNKKNFEINLSFEAWAKCRGQIYKQFLLFQ